MKTRLTYIFLTILFFILLSGEENPQKVNVDLVFSSNEIDSVLSSAISGEIREIFLHHNTLIRFNTYTKHQYDSLSTKSVKNLTGSNSRNFLLRFSIDRAQRKNFGSPFLELFQIKDSLDNSPKHKKIFTADLYKKPIVSVIREIPRNKSVNIVTDRTNILYYENLLRQNISDQKPENVKFLDIKKINTFDQDKSEIHFICPLTDFIQTTDINSIKTFLKKSNSPNIVFSSRLKNNRTILFFDQARYYKKRARQIAIVLRENVEDNLQFDGGFVNNLDDCIIRYDLSNHSNTNKHFPFLHSDKIELKDIVNYCLKVNPKYRAERMNTKLAAMESDKVSSQYYPQLDLFTTGLWVDEHRAETSFGKQAEKTVNSQVQLSQVLFSDQLNAKSYISELQTLIAGQKENISQKELVFAVSAAYLKLLISESLKEISRNHLELISENLRLAGIRNRIGKTDKLDLVRWQTEYTNEKIKYLEAERNRKIAAINLNTLLDLDTRLKWKTTQNDIELLLDKFLDKNFVRFFKPDADMEKMKTDLYEKSLTNANSIKIIDHLLKITEREEANLFRENYIPTLKGNVNLRYYLYRDGKGDDFNPPAAMQDLFKPFEDEQWEINITAKLPLFSGGSNKISREKKIVESEQLLYEKSDHLKNLEKSVNEIIVRLRESYQNIFNSAETRKAANVNLTTLRERYKTGRISLLKLLDAQEFLRRTDEMESIAKFKYLIDVFTLQRITGIDLLNEENFNLIH